MKAVIFDMDGVLIDSEPLWQEAEIEVFGTIGVELDNEMCAQTTGLRIDEAVAHWFDRRPWPGPTVAEVAATVVDRVSALITERGRPLPGLSPLLDLLAERGVPLAVASSSPIGLIETVITHLGHDDLFSVVHSATNEPLGKPHPGVYLTAASLLGVHPTECLAFEDSVNGVLAAKSARMRCVAVPAPTDRADPRFAIADAVVPSLDAIDTDLLDRLWRDC
ncbi:MAG: hexitol phosphatase HxpB [Actinomycetota bacterium]|nr:hexitol phosphatase HxpB [Actinomycetota bacterium]